MLAIERNILRSTLVLSTYSKHNDDDDDDDDNDIEKKGGKRRRSISGIAYREHTTRSALSKDALFVFVPNHQQILVQKGR